MLQWLGHGESEPVWMLVYVPGYDYIVCLLASSKVLAQAHIMIQAMLQVQIKVKAPLCSRHQVNCCHTRYAIAVSSQIFGRHMCLAHITGTQNPPMTSCYVTPSVQGDSSHGNEIRYEEDSFQIAIKNCASTCFTNSMQDFCEKSLKIRKTVQGLGKVLITYKGTVLWSMLDDQGRQHDFKIPNVHYHPPLPFRLLSPQRIAQVRKDLAGTGTITSHTHVKLFWCSK
jgi:hypothetical protein